jgi:hypothetical protein
MCSELFVPNENSVRPIADVIPPRRAAKLKEFDDLLESGKGHSRGTRVQGSAVWRQTVRAAQRQRMHGRFGLFQHSSVEEGHFLRSALCIVIMCPQAR